VRGPNEYDQAVAVLTRTCRFPATLGNHLLLYSHSGGINLGDELLRLASFYTTHSLLSAAEARVINENVKLWARIVRGCVDTYGAETVLVAEPWATTYGDFNPIMTPVLPQRIAGHPKVESQSIIQRTPYFWAIFGAVLAVAFALGVALYRWKPWQRKWVIQFA